MANPNPKVPPKEIRLQALGVEALDPGEASVRIRVRIPEEAVAVVEAANPKVRGKALMLGLEALGLWKGGEDEEAQAGQ